MCEKDSWSIFYFKWNITNTFLCCQFHPFLIWWIYFDMFVIFTLTLFRLHIYCRMRIVHWLWDECTTFQLPQCGPGCDPVRILCFYLHSPTGLKTMQTGSCCDSLSAVHWWQTADLTLVILMSYTRKQGLVLSSEVSVQSVRVFVLFTPDSNNKTLGETLNVFRVKVLSTYWIMCKHRGSDGGGCTAAGSSCCWAQHVCKLHTCTGWVSILIACVLVFWMTDFKVTRATVSFF